MDNQPATEQNIVGIEESSLPQISRWDLFRAFAFIPITYLMIILSVTVTFALVILVIVGIYYAITSFFECPPGILISFAFLGMITLLSITIQAVIRSFFTDSAWEWALPVQENGEEIESALQEVCFRLNVSLPDNVLLCFGPEFYVTQIPINTYPKKS